MKAWVRRNGVCVIAAITAVLYLIPPAYEALIGAPR